jgi:hypothetical protein
MKRFFILTAAAVILWTAPGAVNPGAKKSSRSVDSLKESDFNWVKSCNSDGILVYWSKVEGSEIIAFKGEGLVDAPLDQVASVILDTTRSPEWVESLKEARVLNVVSPTEFIEYERIGTPVLMAGRDFVNRVTLDYEAKVARFSIHYQSAEDSLAPPGKKYVRGEIFCRFKLVPMTLSEQTYVEAVFYCDPKGTVFKWFVNYFKQGWPLTTFGKLRKQLKKPGLQVLPMVTNLMNQPKVVLVPSPKTGKP